MQYRQTLKYHEEELAGAELVEKQPEWQNGTGPPSYVLHSLTKGHSQASHGSTCEIGNGAKERVSVTFSSCEGDLKAIVSLLRERSESNSHHPSVPGVGRSAQQSKLCYEEDRRFGSGEKSGVFKKSLY